MATYALRPARETRAGGLRGTRVAVPLGIGSAVFVSQYASTRAREIIKPVIELLAGIPSVVLGFFALIVMATWFQDWFGFESRLNAVVAGAALSVAIIQILLVECAGHTVGIPITRVLRTLDVARGEVRASGRQMAILFEEEAVPLLSLRKLLQLPARPHRGSLPVVVTEGRRRRGGLVVDRLVGQREVFVKTLAFPLDRLGGVNGATVLGDGSVIFIIDPQALLEERAEAAAARPAGGVS